MARATNLLTFSLSPMEKMLSSSDSEFVQYDTSSAYSSPHCFFDNLYANGWTNPILNYSAQVEQNQSKENQSHNMSDHLTSLMNSQNQNQSLVPKLEDFFENQDSSSLTRIYHHAYRQDLKANAGFQAFSTNSGSEVDDSASIAKQQATPGEFGSAHSVESSKNELALISSSSKGTSSLGTQSSDKAVVAADSDGSKNIGGSFGQRTSIFRGITRHRWTGRYEAHLWDNSCRREGQARKGRQVYLGGYDKEEKAARAYDLAALKYWGPTAITNYPVSNYTKELEEMKHAGKQEFIASLRRKSSGFSRGASIYRGVTRHHQQGRWQARIGRVAGNKDLYLGTFATQEEAAEAYDIAAIKFRGENAVTNFEMSRYDVEAILNNSLPVGGVAKRLKLSLESEKKAPMSDSQQPQCRRNVSSSINFSTIQPIAYYHHNHFQHLQPTNAGSGTEESAVTISNAIRLPPEAEFYIWPHQSY